jgi:hypothetical protein
MKNSLKLKREIFIIDFCRKKGWNHNELKPSQLISIVKNKEYPK